MSFGRPGCRGVEPFLANLQALLTEAERQGVSHFDAVVSAQAVFDSEDRYLFTVPWIGRGCEESIAELKAAVDRITIVLNAIPGANLSVPRPDAVVPEELGIPTWVKFAAFGVLGVAALHYLSPLISGFAPAPRRRLAGRSRR